MDANPDVKHYSAVIRDPELREIAERISRNLEASTEFESTFVPSAQLPLWPEPTRGVPNDVLRSALFAAIQGKGRALLNQRLIAAYDGNQIRYTGGQLDQSDLDVWEQVLHLARQHPLGTVCQFKGGACLKAIGRSTGKANYQCLHGALLRLSSSTVEFRRGRQIYGRGIIAAFNIDEE